MVFIHEPKGIVAFYHKFCKIYYNNHNYHNLIIFITDVVSGRGPEIIIFNEIIDGEYYVKLYDKYYKSDIPLAKSNAYVRLNNYLGVMDYVRLTPDTELTIDNEWHVFSVVDDSFVFH